MLPRAEPRGASTLLTQVVLPVLYRATHDESDRVKRAEEEKEDLGEEPTLAG